MPHASNVLMSGVIITVVMYCHDEAEYRRGISQNVNSGSLLFAMARSRVSSQEFVDTMQREGLWPIPAGAPIGLNFPVRHACNPDVLADFLLVNTPPGGAVLFDNHV